MRETNTPTFDQQLLRRLSGSFFADLDSDDVHHIIDILKLPDEEFVETLSNEPGVIGLLRHLGMVGVHGLVRAEMSRQSELESN